VLIETERAVKLYLAGPLGFSEAGREFQDRVLIPQLTDGGFEVLDPWKLTDSAQIAEIMAMPYGIAKRQAWRNLNVKIGNNNRHAIDDCDFVVAVLDGVDVDSGTAAEIGYAYAKGKLIFGYRGDFRLSADNEGAVINLQVEFFVLDSGGEIYHDLTSLLDAVRNKYPKM
jgi:nucleoside 2-deoxyribosyltransferase